MGRKANFCKKKKVHSSRPHACCSAASARPRSGRRVRSLLSATVGVSQLREMVMAGLAVAGLTQLGARQLSRLKAVRMTQGCDQTLRVWAKSELPGFFWKSVGFPLRFSRRWARFPAKLLETCFFKPPKFPKKLLETLSQGNQQCARETTNTCRP